MCEVILYYLMKCDGGEEEGKEIEILIDCCEIFYCFKFLKLWYSKIFFNVLEGVNISGEF